MTKEFQLDTAITGFPAQSKLIIDSATDADVLAAFLNNTPFPDRNLELGRISADFDGQSDKPVSFGNTEVKFKAKASATLGLGVYNTSDRLLAALAFKASSDLSLGWDDNGDRFALLVASYDAAISTSGSHPIGALGSATFGLEGEHAAGFAIVKRFAKTDLAADVVAGLLRGWRLPSRVASATDLEVGAAVLVEASGSVGLKVGATLGYDFSFVREIQAGGLAGDLGLKVATALTTQFGLHFSGRFILCVERVGAATENKLRVRLFKLAKKGWDFALNVSVGATPVTPTLPGSADEFVELVFGVHGKQVVADLQKLAKWTDPTKSAADLVAGLASETALDLIRSATGIDPLQKFAEAQAAFTKGLAAWENLPAKASAWIWEQLRQTGGITAADTTKLDAALAALANPDADVVKKFLTDLATKAGINQDITGKLLDAISDDGVLALFNRVPEVQAYARQLQQLLDKDFLKNLQARLTALLSLDQVLDQAKTNWTQIDAAGWLHSRLSAFFGAALADTQIEQVRAAINNVINHRNTVYAALTKAAARTYEGKFSYAYESATTKQALVDATFDLTPAANGTITPAMAAYRAIISGGDWSALFLQQIEGVALRSAVLTHGIERKTHIQFTLPMLKSDFTSITTSLAKLSIETEGADVVATYSLNATNEEKSTGRYNSRLVLTAAYFAGREPGLRLHSGAPGHWSYVYRFIRANASFSELKSLLQPIQQAYFRAKFPAPAGSFDNWLLDLDRSVEATLHNGPNTFGDLLAAFEVSMPATHLSAWFVPRTKQEKFAAACRASLAVQRLLRRLLLQSYVSDLSKINSGPATASLLVYASLPATNGMVYDESDDEIVSSNSNYYPDWPDAKVIAGLARLPVATAQLAAHMVDLRSRLDAAGRHHDADFFAPHAIDRIISDAAKFTGYTGLVRSLLFVEAELVRGVANAIATASDFAGSANATPASALAALSATGATITETFNKKLDSIYLPSSVKSIGSLVFCEATCAIGAAGVARQRVLLAITAMNRTPSFKLADFLDGKNPEKPADVASEQRLFQD